LWPQPPDTSTLSARASGIRFTPTRNTLAPPACRASSCTAPPRWRFPSRRFSKSWASKCGECAAALPAWCSCRARSRCTRRVICPRRATRSFSRRATKKARRSSSAGESDKINRTSFMLRSTKIVATLGPASSDPAVLERMVRAGVDVVPLNFSHGTADDHLARAALVKEIASKLGRTVAILCDLQGPKIRVGKFKEGKVALEKGQKFVLDAGCEMGDGN